MKCPHCGELTALGSTADGKTAPAASSKATPRTVTSQANSPSPKPAAPKSRPVQPVASDPFGTDLFASSPQSRPLDGAAPSQAYNPYAFPSAAQSGALPSSSTRLVSSKPQLAQKSAVGPAIILTVQAVIAILLSLIAIASVLFRGPESYGNLDPDEVEVARRLRMLFAALTFLGCIYQGVILGGAIQMFRGKSPTYGKIACVLAIVPVTFFTFYLCSGILFYPLALGGGIWGLICLHTPSGANHSGASVSGPTSYAPTNYAPSVDTQGTKSAEEISKPRAILMLVGGVIFTIGPVAAIGFLSYSMFNGEQDDQVRKPIKGILTMITFFIVGIGLLTQGYQALSKKR